MSRDRTIGLTLAERFAASGVGGAAGAGTLAPRRHCWVKGPVEDPGPWPGLVLSWRRDGTGAWAAWVVYLVGEDLELVVQAWVAADRLRPVGP